MTTLRWERRACSRNDLPPVGMTTLEKSLPRRPVRSLPLGSNSLQRTQEKKSARPVTPPIPFPLTLCGPELNNCEASAQSSCAALAAGKEWYERLQPQGGGSFGTRQPACGRGGRAARKRDGGVYRVLQCGSRARGAPAFDQSAAHGRGKTAADGRLHGRGQQTLSARAIPNAATFVRAGGLLCALVML